MKNSVSIYLAGKIQKSHENPNETYWTEEDIQLIQNISDPLKIHFLNPAIRTDDLSDQLSVFGRDMTQVYSVDLVLVDARERRGLGVGAEMMWAKMNHLAVLTLAPWGSHYRKKKTSLLGVEVDNWVHPFIECLSDGIVDDLEAASSWIKKIFLEQQVTIRGPEYIQKAMQYYCTSQFDCDTPMQDLATSCQTLQEKIQDIKTGAF